MTMGAAVLLSTAVSAFAAHSTQSTPATQSTPSTSSHKSSMHNSTARASQMHKASGKIVSINDTTLVLDQKVKGKEQQETYTLNSSTKRTGNLQPGARATVHYQSESNSMVATSVSAQNSTSSAHHSTKQGTSKPSGR
jgi:hypothetical protein